MKPAVTKLTVIGLIAAFGMIAPPSAGADPAWQHDFVFKCDSPVPNSRLIAKTYRGTVERTGLVASCEVASGGWFHVTIPGDLDILPQGFAPVNKVTLEIFVDGVLCATTSEKAYGPGSSTVVPPDLSQAWAVATCGTMTLAAFGPYNQKTGGAASP
jgi:hypothetical protein